jgi:hypothetical protein
VEYSGFELLSPQQIGQKFVNEVANPNEMLLFYRKRNMTGKSGGLFMMKFFEFLFFFALHFIFF